MGMFISLTRVNHRIRKITAAGVVSTLAGGTQGFANGTGAAARFNSPEGVAVGPGPAFDVYVADQVNYRIRKITAAGFVSTLAGDGTADFADGPGGSARLFNPYGVAVDSLGNVIVGDYENHKIRKITPAGDVTTLAGSTNGFADGNAASAQFANPRGVAVDSSSKVYVADIGNDKIRKIE